MNELERLLALATLNITVETDPARYVANAVPSTSGNPAKARERFGWSPQVAIETTLQAALDGFRAG